MSVQDVIDRRSAFVVVQGDAAEVLREIPSESVDAIVTDPPAGISFMGKTWDGDKGGRDEWIAWLTGILREAFRTLKPGGHAVVWALPRTSHWTGLAIENAGFEIRDSLHHVFGQGFPKSLDVSKAIDKMRHDRAEILRVTTWIRERRDEAGKTNEQIDAAFGFHGMAGHWTSQASQPAIPTLDQIPTLLDVLGVVDVPDDVSRLIFELNGRKGQPGSAWFTREKLAPVERPAGNVADTVFGGGGWQAEPWRTAPANERSAEWQGFGTALKPSHEVWWLARKPFDGTVAANVLAHGTGAIDVDGCRVAHASAEDFAKHKTMVDRLKAQGGSLGNSWKNGSDLSGASDANTLGRWPSNFVLTHAPECEIIGTRNVRTGTAHEPETDRGAERVRGAPDRNLGRVVGYAGSDGFEAVDDVRCAPGCPVAAIDEQSGKSKGFLRQPTGRAIYPTEGTAMIWNPNHVMDTTVRGFADSGGASRFFPCFYTAKVSVAEREQGARLLTRKSLTERLGVERKRVNGHPTVKPSSLMEWLVQLVARPGALVLDPFAGSGSTGIAAVRLGRRFVGVEVEAASAKTARSRVASAAARRSAP